MMILSFLVIQAFSRTKYGIMIDAGSSGTRAHIYQWEKTPGIPNVQPAPNVSNAWAIKAKIRLADAATNNTVISSIFRTIIEYCSKRIPEAELVRTSIFVYATAGMRLLSVSDQQRVIEETYGFLKSNSPFKVKLDNIRVIDGIEEGVYGWLSVNHLLGHFINNRPTVGALDLGGASFQIAMQLDDTEASSSKYYVTIGNKRIVVFAHSYLGYGVDVSSRTISKSISAVMRNDTVINPCFPNGYTGVSGKINVVGTGDFEHCSSLIEKIMVQSPGFEAVNIPTLQKRNEFVGMANLYFANEFFGLPSDSSLEELKAKSSGYCKTPWAESFNKVKGTGAQDYAHTYCFCGVYQHTLLTKGYSFQDGKTKLLKKDTIDGVDLSWTIGAMLSKVSDIEISEVSPLPIKAIIASNIVGFCVLLPIYIIVGRKFKTIRRHSNSIPV